MMNRSLESSGLNILNLSSDIELPIFTESAITIQPQIGGDFSGSRRPIPVSTIDWRTTNLTQFTPMHGLDFLIGAEQVHIQQTIELNDLLASVESENRYTVKVPQGETLYLASESSTSWQRLCFGSQRAFSIRLYDQTRQEAINFIRKLACMPLCNCNCFCTQELQVWIPPGQYIGMVKQEWTLSPTTVPLFSVFNEQHIIVYKIEATTSPLCTGCCCFTTHQDIQFKIYSADGTTQLGSITNQWDQLNVTYNLCLIFPTRNSSSHNKALLLGAAFLLEYMYYEHLKYPKCCR